MAKGKRTNRTRRRTRSVWEVALHLQTPTEPVWKYLWPALALAFVARAGIALSGDFMLHPDEIMQYLEPAHRLVFGNGVIYWEFFYGARSWLVPGSVAGVLALFDGVGLGEPGWYVGGVKLMFCAVSLLIPGGMYFFARQHFGETAARVALIAGAFWYELVGFAHKPMTEFVATAVAMALLALCVRPLRPRTAWLVALLAVLAAGIRLQYAPLALALLGLAFFRSEKRAKIHLAVAAVAFFLAVGVFDAVTWNAGLFHSYLTNIHFNLALEDMRSGSSPAYQFLSWLLFASGGSILLCVAVALRDLRRYGFTLALIALILLIHSAEAHKEYRFVFVVIPLYLLVGADLVARFAGRAGKPRWGYGLVGIAFAAISLAGILNALPKQDDAYRLIYAPEKVPVRFLRDPDPVFAAYRYLASTADVVAVWQVDQVYHDLPGYYHLHREIPFYDAITGRNTGIQKDVTTLRASVSHILSADPNLAVPGYRVAKTFGTLRILRREDNASPIRQWQTYTPIMPDKFSDQIMQRMNPDIPLPPANHNIRFRE